MVDEKGVPESRRTVEDHLHDTSQLDGEAAIREIQRLSRENAEMHATVMDMYARIIPEEIAKGVADATAIRPTTLPESDEDLDIIADWEKVVTILANARRIVDQQAEDEGLWFEATTASEAYLQQALRRLHAAVEESP